MSAVTPSIASNELAQLNERSREIFRQIVDAYLTTGEPVGSRNISRLLPNSLSPASVRNVMQDLEMLGLIQAPHTSAGRRPTELGLRFFVDAMLEFGDLAAQDRAQIDAQIRAGAPSRTLEGVLTDASALLSGLSRGAGVVVTAKRDQRLKHIEFVRLEPTQALVILVSEDGAVENRVIAVPIGLPTSALVEASNYLNARARGKTLDDLRRDMGTALDAGRAELDDLTARLIATGLASWGGGPADMPQQLIVRGQANLLEDLHAVEDLERIRLLFADIEAKKDLIDLLGRAEAGDGVRIFIGSENKLFSLSGSSMIAAPFRDASQKIVGVLGVIGPTRLNYARVVPMVDYTAKVVGKLLNR
ncbi:heat-inducible transcription repressor HrcA [Labrys miyagiensis]|uniref:Heat-inducible transcription repressor HrcA n=1 Tax=Labrys miyagiensis TaxID=346912 RepID=A0ABQ6CRU3_9HYPH|nr:heat-inducible transcriptional repressor HrcA [Labrys miyagiensis]GLS23053.1 heat-inducible transcription repressor HrcA [Labrys miyagiensis]